MSNVLLLFVFLVLSPFVGCVTFHDGFAVLGYVPEWRYGGVDWHFAAAHLTHIILFSLEIDQEGELTALDRQPSKVENEALLKAAREHDTKVLICFGGYGRSNGLPIVSTSRKLREKLVKNIMKFVNENGYDGVDMNWEYPQTGAQWQGLFEILRGLRKELDKQNGVLTMATYPGQEGGLPKDIVRQVDYVLTMSYDNMCSHPKRQPPCHHSTMEFAEWTIQQTEGTNLPLHKLCLGVPFYARHGYTGDWKAYYDMVKWDPSLTTTNTHLDTATDQSGGEYYFNNRDTIIAKTKLSLDKKIGGIMIWEIGQDVQPHDEISLMKAIVDGWNQWHALAKQTGNDEL